MQKRTELRVDRVSKGLHLDSGLFALGDGNDAVANAEVFLSGCRCVREYMAYHKVLSFQAQFDPNTDEVILGSLGSTRRQPQDEGQISRHFNCWI